MTIVDLYLLIISAFLGLYGLGCSIECAISLKLLCGDDKARSLFTPLWEVTNVFLVFGFTGVAVIFAGGLHTLANALLPTLSVALFALLVRACAGLALFYTSAKPKWLLALFTLASFAVPLSFAAAGVYLLTGQLFSHSVIGWSVMAATLAGLIAVGFVLVDQYLRRATSGVAELAYLVWLLVLGSLVPLAVGHSANILAKAPVAILSIICLVGLLIVLGRYTFRWITYWWYVPLLALAAPILLAWSNRPYLISGQLSLASAYSAQAYSTFFLIGAMIILPLLAVGFWLLIKLLSTSSVKT